MDDKELKYQKAREIASVIMCSNPDIKFDLPHCKCVCCCF